MQVKKNPNGTSGWATILHSTNPTYSPHALNPQYRIHLCAFNPCRAVYTASKYGNVGAPLHLQEVPKRCGLLSVVEPSGSQQTAVAEPSNEAATPVAELAPTGPVEPAPVEEPATVEPPPKAEPAPVHTPAVPPPLPPPADAPPPVMGPAVDADMAEVPGCPREAALKNMKPPAPSSPIDVDSQVVADAAVTIEEDTAVAAQHRIHATLLALARSIRKPTTYAGYSAFILMGLLKKCQP